MLFPANCLIHCLRFDPSTLFELFGSERFLFGFVVESIRFFGHQKHLLIFVELGVTPSTSTFDEFSFARMTISNLHKHPYGGLGGYCPRVRSVYSLRLNDLSILFILAGFRLIVKTFSVFIAIADTNKFCHVVVALTREYLELAFVRNHKNGEVMTLDASMFLEHD